MSEIIVEKDDIKDITVSIVGVVYGLTMMTAQTALACNVLKYS